MEEKNEHNGSILSKESREDMQGRKASRNSVIKAVGIFFLLAVVTVVIAGYLYFGKSDYEKGSAFYKDKKFTEALTEFQKVDPDDKDFNNAQSSINYINGLRSFDDGNKTEAAVFLSKVRSDDYYYDDVKLMLANLNEASTGNDLQSQIDKLKDTRDTVIVKKEVTAAPVKNTEPADPRIQADLELSRKYVSDAGNSISRFESVYQSARTAPLGAKSDYGKSLESVNKEFNSLKYLADNKDAGVMELRRVTGDWMSKRIAFIRQMLSEKSEVETASSRPIREEGDRLYSAMISQLNKVRKK